jgi:hypothetical protein
MIVLGNGDKLQGDASVASKVDYTIHGVSGSTYTLFANGQLSDSAASDLYTASAAIAVTSIICVNTHTSAVTVNLFLLKSGGTARRILSKTLSIPAGDTLIFDGQKAQIGVTGGISDITAFLDNTAGGTDALTTKAPTSNVLFDHNAARTAVHGIGTKNIATVSIAAKYIYVDKEAVGTGDGTSYTNAFTTIQAAVDSCPDIIAHAYTIYVRAGTKATGTANTNTANKLAVSTGPFTGTNADWVGRRVYNITDNLWGIVKARDDNNTLSVMDTAGADYDLFPDGNEQYSIEPKPYRETVYLNSSESYAGHVVIGSLIILGEFAFYGHALSNRTAATGDCLSNGQTAWTAVVGGGTKVCSADTVYWQSLDKSAKIVTTGCGIEPLAYWNTAATYDISACTHISFWIRTSIAINANELGIIVDEDLAIGGTGSHDHIAIGAISANTWTKVMLAMPSYASFNAVKSIGIEQLVDIADCSIWIDDVLVGVPGSLYKSGTNFTGIKVGDLVYICNAASGGTYANAIEYMVATVTDVTNAATGTLLVSNTSQFMNAYSTYAIIQTEISGSNDGVTKTRYSVVNATSIDNLFIRGLLFNLCSGAVIMPINAYVTIEGCYFENGGCTIWTTAKSSVTINYSYLSCTTSAVSLANLYATGLCYIYILNCAMKSTASLFGLYTEFNCSSIVVGSVLDTSACAYRCTYSSAGRMLWSTITPNVTQGIMLLYNGVCGQTHGRNDAVTEDDGGHTDYTYVAAYTDH